MAETDPFDPLAEALADQVERAAHVIRTNEKDLRNKLAADATTRRSREGSYEVQLHQATISVLDRMERLATPLGRIFCKSALPVTKSKVKPTSALGPAKLTRISENRSERNYEVTIEPVDIVTQVATAPLTDGAIARMKGEHLLFSGLVISCFPDTSFIVPAGTDIRDLRFRRALNVNQQIKDEATQAAASRLLYRVETFVSSEGPRAEVCTHAVNTSSHNDMRSDEQYLEPLTIVWQMGILIGAKNR